MSSEQELHPDLQQRLVDALYGTGTRRSDSIEELADALIAVAKFALASRSSSDEQRAEVVPDRIFKASVRLYNYLNAPNPKPWSDQSYDTQLKWRDAVRIVLDNASPFPAVATGGVTEDTLSEILSEEVARQQWTFSCDIDFNKLARAALGVRDEGMQETGAIRICPERDGLCPHGTSCPYNHDRYHCNIAASRANLPTPVLKGTGV